MAKKFFNLTTFILILILLIASQGWAAKRAWQLDDQFRLKRISELEASPDGEELIFVVSETNLSAKKSQTTLWQYRLKDARFKPLLQIEGSIDSLRWSPDSSKIAYFFSASGELSL